MVRFTSEDLRRLADAIDNREKYGNMCGVVYLRMKKHPNGKEFAECYSNFYRFEEVER